MNKYFMSKYNELYFCKEENKYILFNSNVCNWLLLDEIGKNIYTILEKNCDAESACNILLKEYCAEYSEVYCDVLEFCEKLKENGYLFERENVECLDNSSDEFIDKYPYNVMMISVTSACNLDCTYCYNKDRRYKSLNAQFDYDETKIQSIFKQFKKDGGVGVLFTGGEPLLYEGIQQLCKIVKDNGLKTRLITNTTMLYKITNLEDILFYIDDIVLSLDSLKQSELKKLWNVKDVDLYEIEMGLKRLNKYSLEKKKMNVIVSPIVSKVNKDSLHYVLEKSIEWLSDCVIKIEPTQYMQIGKECDNTLSISEDEYICAYINAFKKNNIMDDTIFFSALTHNGKYYPYPVKNKFLCKPSFFIKENGDVYPCQNLVDSKYFLGNINIDAYKKINDKFIDIMQKETLINYSECRNCSFKYICPYKGGICKNKEKDCKEKLLKLMCRTIKDRS